MDKLTSLIHAVNAVQSNDTENEKLDELQVLEWIGSDHYIEWGGSDEVVIKIIVQVANGEYSPSLLKKEILDYQD